MFAVSAFQFMYNITLESLYDAYIDTNRSTADMIPFSLRIDEELYRLHKEIQNGTYKISRTKAFMVKGRKKREIFAMQPRDKIVNHWVKIRLEPLFEQEFVDGCYSCRKGKGGAAFARDVREAIQKATANYSKRCYFAHLDVRNFFLSINRECALDKTLKVVERYGGDDKETLKWLVSEILLYAPEKDYYICGNPKDWDGYPPEKSLLTNGDGVGLMMGSVNSQFVANLMLTATDKFIEGLGLGVFRYVDDILLISEDRRSLLENIPKIERFLNEDTGLILHRDKRYFQDSSKGVGMIGYFFKERRTYISNRCIGNALSRVHALKKEEVKAERLVSCVNSYLGRTLDCRAYRQRAKIIAAISPEWDRDIYAKGDLRKIVKRKKKTIFAKNDFTGII